MMIAVPPEVLSETERSLQTFGRVVLCQIIRAEGSTPGKVGWKLLARPDASFVGNLGGGAFEALVKADALAKLRARAGVEASEIKRYYLTEEASRGGATGMVCGGMAEVVLEVMVAPHGLGVCGGGPGGQALGRAGSMAGVGVLMVDDRPEFRDPDLYPAGTLLAEVNRDYEQDFLSPLEHRDLYVAVVSRCWETDTAALAAVLRQAPESLRYLGLMGSRRKIARVREELTARNLDLSALGGVELHAPIGLPLGGDSPGEIAISILAEVIGKRYEKSAVNS